MKLNIALYHYNNGVGLTTDVNCLYAILTNNGFNVSIIDLSAEMTSNKYDIGIYIQNFTPNTLESNKINCIFANEEWISEDDLKELKNFDAVFVKSKFAESILSIYAKNVINVGFFTKSRYNPTIKSKNSCLFFNGKSIQKNLEFILDEFGSNLSNIPITILESSWVDYKLPENSKINYHKGYKTNDEIDYFLNSHNTHLCLSRFEAWGHYFYEGLSVGALVYALKIPQFVEHVDSDLVVYVEAEAQSRDEDILFLKHLHADGKHYPYRLSWRPNISDFREKFNMREEYLNKYSPSKIRIAFKQICDNNKQNILKNIISL
jgi:hypothetical protein